MASPVLVSQPPPKEVLQPGIPSIQFVRFSFPTRVEPTVLHFDPHLDTHARAATRPAQVLLGTLYDFSFRVVKPIPVRLETNDAFVVASWQDVDEFGTGTSMSSACEELGHTLVELYRSLEADEARLGPDLRRVWAVLKEYLVRRK